MSEHTPGATRAASRIFSKMHSYAGLESWIVPDMAYEIDKEFGDLLAGCERLIKNLDNGRPLTGAFQNIRDALAILNPDCGASPESNGEREEQ